MIGPYIGDVKTQFRGVVEQALRGMISGKLLLGYFGKYPACKRVWLLLFDYKWANVNL